MRINITGKHMDVTDAIKELIEKKMKKLDKFFEDDTNVKVLLSVEKDRNIMEATIHYNGMIIRAEDYTRDMYNNDITNGPSSATVRTSNRWRSPDFWFPSKRNLQPNSTLHKHNRPKW